MDLIDAHRTFHPNAAEYTFFPDALGTFSRINHMLGHRTNLNKFKKTEITSSSIFSKHSDMKLEINYKKEAGKTTHLWRLNRMLVAWSVDIGSVTTREAMGSSQDRAPLPPLPCSPLGSCCRITLTSYTFPAFQRINLIREVKKRRNKGKWSSKTK